MVQVQLKIVEEGLKHPIGDLTKFLKLQLFEDDIIVSEDADLTLKIKFTRDNDQDLILIALREKDKHKIAEKVIHYLEHTWLEDVCSEAHALISLTMANA
jgi:hypothetical protein